jgi:hypothetical protein
MIEICIESEIRSAFNRKYVRLLFLLLLYWEELIKYIICPYLIYNGRVGVLCL